MDQEKKHLVAMLRTFEAGVLVTKSADGQLHGRPMEVAHIDEDGSVYFSTSVTSPKIAELKADPTVGVFFQKSREWVSLSGTAQILNDRELVHQFWKEPWRVWFPDGKDSAEIRLIHVAPSIAEYWDISGKQAVTFAFEALKAYLTGTKPDRRDGNAKIAM